MVLQNSGRYNKDRDKSEDKKSRSVALLHSLSLLVVFKHFFHYRSPVKVFLGTADGLRQPAHIPNSL